MSLSVEAKCCAAPHDKEAGRQVQHNSQSEQSSLTWQFSRRLGPRVKVLASASADCKSTSFGLQQMMLSQQDRHLHDDAKREQHHAMHHQIRFTMSDSDDENKMVSSMESGEEPTDCTKQAARGSSCFCCSPHLVHLSVSPTCSLKHCHACLTAGH